MLGHTCRGIGYFVRGALERHREGGSFEERFFSRTETPLYAGMRMVDILGHVNNAMYLKLLEFARWHHLGSTGLTMELYKHQITFVIASSDILFLREIKGRTPLIGTTQIVDITDGLPADAPRDTAARQSKKWIVMQQDLWDRDTHVRYASMVGRLATVTKNSPQLQERFQALERRKALAAGLEPPPTNGTSSKKRFVPVSGDIAMDLIGLDYDRVVVPRLEQIRREVYAPGDGAATSTLSMPDVIRVSCEADRVWRDAIRAAKPTLTPRNSRR